MLKNGFQLKNTEDAEIWRLILKMLEKDPEDRPTALEIYNDPIFDDVRNEGTTHDFALTRPSMSCIPLE